MKGWNAIDWQWFSAENMMTMHMKFFRMNFDYWISLNNPCHKFVYVIIQRPHINWSSTAKLGCKSSQILVLINWYKNRFEHIDTHWSTFNISFLINLYISQILTLRNCPSIIAFLFQASTNSPRSWEPPMQYLTMNY